MSHPPFVHTDEPGATGYRGREIGRRRFVGYVLAGSTLIVAGRYVADPEQAAAADKLPVEGGGGASPIPSNDMPSDNYDFMDFMREQTRAVTPLLTLEVTPQGRIHFDMPRNEVGQGVEGGVAQIISDQLEMSYDQVDVTQSKARVDMFDAQLTGGSSSTYSLWEPLRELSELIRQKLIGAAAKTWDISPSKLRTRDGYVLGPRGKKMSYADAGSIAASAQNEFVGTMLNAAIGPPKRGVIGKSVPRKDIHAIVTGTKQFAMDLDIPGALPTMCARPPHFNGTVNKVNNMDAVKNMPGVTDVAVMNGTHRSQVVAVRANTFGQCIDAVRALDVDWAVGSTGGINTDQIFEKIASVALPMEPAPPGSEVFENSYKFHYRTSGPLEPNSAVADVKPDQAEIWAGSKIPGTPLAMVAEELGLPLDKVILNVIYGGGSFGTLLHGDRIMEAARASKAFGKPVRLMWHRTDQLRFGRQHPGSISHVRATKAGNSVTSYTQWHASGCCDFTHSAGDVISGRLMKKDPSHYWGNTSVTDWFYQIVTSVPYNFGPTRSALTEVFEYDFLPTGPVRNVYSPDVAVARELLVEDLATGFGMDGYQFRRTFAKNPSMVAALDAVAKRGDWGRTMPAGTAQAIAIHGEYKCQLACLMEVDNRPAAVKAHEANGGIGPRVTKAIFAGAMGIPMNPDQCKAQFMGGMMDGIAAAYAEVADWQDGLPLQGGWDDYGWTRHWDCPLEYDFIVIDDGSLVPSGTGETGNGAGYAAAAIALQKVLGKKVTSLPVFYGDPRMPAATIPKTPSMPQSPTRILPH
ncbi:MAG TPA: molybdopterin cofactor-binding domain-containing protein [Sporichthyaceae bacterium]|jgi:isoquinoline 1-oxidoreductase beta subunit|nr:molybdopterin cofactor-binding domain-containing protein [Sporichthyaceae bacterium]